MTAIRLKVVESYFFYRKLFRSDIKIIFMEQRDSLRALDAFAENPVWFLVLA